MRELFRKLSGTPMGRYIDYCGTSETPIEYDFWTMVWAISNALGRRVIIPRPNAPVFMNIYCILVASSGITRKSTSVRRGMKLVQATYSDVEGPLLIDTKMTPEALELNLAHRSITKGSATCCIAIDELVKFLGRETYTINMPTLLTDLYDCPDMRYGGGSVLHGRMSMKNVFVTLLSGSTPAWLMRAVNPDVIEGGFTSRVIFVVAEKPKASIVWPDSESNKSAWNDAVDGLRHIMNTSFKRSQIEVTKGAVNALRDWYESRTIRQDPFHNSFQAREDGHILRLAGIMAVNDDYWEVQYKHVANAINIIEEVRESAAAIFETSGVDLKLIEAIDRLRATLISGGTTGVSQTTIVKRMQNYMKGERLTLCLDIMHEMGMVQKFANVRVNKVGRPTTLWRATNVLLRDDAVHNIMAQFEA